MLSYRADIDGLRAVAVLSVIAFHAFPDLLPGGFVGVDIFFSIAGFLITSILLSGFSNGTLSLREFYSRRVRRIFPTLLVVLAFCTVFGWFALFPDEYKQLGQHTVAGAGFVSNLFFMMEEGYFSNLAETKPLLHLWSLGIEEQFYIVWPLLLSVLVLRKTFFAVAVGLIATLSFSANIHLTSIDSIQAFYSPLNRFWELLVGGLLAHWCLSKPKTTKLAVTDSRGLARGELTSAVMSLTGAFLILVAVAYTNQQVKFPGWYALLPTLASCLVIAAGPAAPFNRLVLSIRPMVWIGKTSYALYLWHWPLIAFATILESRTPSVATRVCAILLSFLLAWLTTRYIEDPVRKKRKPSAQTLALAMICLAIIGVGIATNDGMPTRSKTMEIAGSQTDELMTELSEWPGWSACPNAPANLPCLIMDPGRPADVAVIGDSHAQHFSFGLREHYKSRGLNVMASTRSACLPFFEAVVNRPGYQCEGAIDKALNEAMHSSTVKTIILAGYANWRIQGNRGNGDPNGYRNNPSAQELQRNSEAFREALHETLARLTTSGKNIVYLVDNPELYFDVRACMIERPIKLPGANGQEPCFVSRQQFDERNQIYHQIIEVERSEFPDIKFVDTWKVLCDLDKCHGTVNGVILFHDRDHLNMAGSQYVIERVTDQLP